MRRSMTVGQHGGDLESGNRLLENYKLTGLKLSFCRIQRHARMLLPPATVNYS